MLLVKQSEKHDREGGEHDVEDLENPLFIENLPGEGTVKTEPELGHDEKYIFVESIRDKIGVTTIRLSAMYEKKVLEELELSDSIV